MPNLRSAYCRARTPGCSSFVRRFGSWLTIGWMTVEAVVAIMAGIAAGSLVLIAFGLDSVIELASAGALMWRFPIHDVLLPLTCVLRALFDRDLGTFLRLGGKKFGDVFAVKPR